MFPKIGDPQIIHLIRVFHYKPSIFWGRDTVDGRNPVNSPVEIGSLSHYLQGFIHPRWCKISAINSIHASEMCILQPCSDLPFLPESWFSGKLP